MTATCTSPQIAARFGKGRNWFARNWRRYRDAQGFPAPLPSAYRGARRRWSRDAVDDWFEANATEKAA